jgi:hypothetical protein
MKRLALSFLVATASACVAAPDKPETPAVPYAQDLVRFGVDPASSLESRFGEVPAQSIERFARFSKVTITNHAATPDDRRRVVAALSLLTPLQRRVAQEHLRSISFADNLPANAQTSRVTCEGCVAFDLIISSQVLKETISEFATRKERTLFDTSGSTLNVSVVAGSRSAVDFIVLHELTHVVDHTLKLMPQAMPGYAIPEDMHTPFSRGVWAEGTKPVAAYAGPLLANVAFKTGSPMRIEQAQALYEELKKTPFPSVYASTVNIEDIAELVALSELTGKQHQPWRIEIRDGAKLVYSYEPMKNPLVRARLLLLERFRSTT